ncbi:hypothetical protein FHW67_003257 [Herbaspirillum sp. Sphag1AN]|nr:hypothetical protein [Herbaspirillum sp. Sphag1AN]MBB3247148.1 hypothetical protein [Herbaspirillum sp. Sphag64]
MTSIATPVRSTATPNTPARSVSPAVPPAIPRKQYQASHQASHHAPRQQRTFSNEASTRVFIDVGLSEEGVQATYQLGHEVGASAAQQWSRLCNLHEYKGVSRTQYSKMTATSRMNLLVDPAYGECFERGFTEGFSSVFKHVAGRN